jgi:hypothetical protein
MKISTIVSLMPREQERVLQKIRRVLPFVFLNVSKWLKLVKWPNITAAEDISKSNCQVAEHIY